MDKNTSKILQSMNPKKESSNSQRPGKLKLRNWLNAIFMLLAIATIAIYFLWPQNNIAIFAIGCTAVVIKATEVMIRMTYKHTRK